MKVQRSITRKSYNSFVASDGVAEVASFSMRNDYNMFVFMSRSGVWRVIVVPPTSSDERIQVVSADNMRSAMNHAFTLFARNWEGK